MSFYLLEEVLFDSADGERVETRLIDGFRRTAGSFSRPMAYLFLLGEH